MKPEMSSVSAAAVAAAAFAQLDPATVARITVLYVSSGAPDVFNVDAVAPTGKAVLKPKRFRFASELELIMLSAVHRPKSTWHTTGKKI